MHNVNIQIYSSVGTHGMQPVVFCYVYPIFRVQKISSQSRWIKNPSASSISKILSYETRGFQEGVERGGYNLNSHCAASVGRSLLSA